MTMFCLTAESGAQKEERKLFTLFVDAIHNLSSFMYIAVYISLFPIQALILENNS